MREFWLRPASRLVALVVAGIVVGFVLGDAAGWFVVSAGLLVLVVLQLVYLQRLKRWLERPDSPAPEGWGAWDTVFSTLYRARRRDETSRAGLAKALQRFQQAAGALPDGVVLLDPELHIEWCNVVAEAHFGIDLKRDDEVPAILAS